MIVRSQPITISLEIGEARKLDEALVKLTDTWQLLNQAAPEIVRDLITILEAKLF